MVGHSHKGVDRTAPFARRFFESMEVALVALFGKEARPTIDAALNDVQRVVGKKSARAPWNVRCSESQMTLTPFSDGGQVPAQAVAGDADRRAQQMVERQQIESRSSQLQAALSVGATIFGALMERKAVSATTIGKATTAIRGAGRAIKESQDVGQAEENREALQQQLAALEAQFKVETDSLIASIDPLTETLETISLKPTKSNIAVKLVALAWVPQWQDAGGQCIAAWQ